MPELFVDEELCNREKGMVIFEPDPEIIYKPSGKRRQRNIQSVDVSKLGDHKHEVGRGKELAAEASKLGKMSEQVYSYFSSDRSVVLGSSSRKNTSVKVPFIPSTWPQYPCEVEMPLEGITLLNYHHTGYPHADSFVTAIGLFEIHGDGDQATLGKIQNVSDFAGFSDDFLRLRSPTVEECRKCFLQVTSSPRPLVVVISQTKLYTFGSGYANVVLGSFKRKIATSTAFSSTSSVAQDPVRFSAPGDSRNVLHGHEFAKGTAAAVPANRSASRRRRWNSRYGGVLVPRDSKTSWVVNIRPKCWSNKDTIWWGKIESMEDAQRIADIVFHYTGSGSFHFLFPSAGERPPPFLNNNLRFLDSLEKRMKYVKIIAKGEKHRARRRELIESVKEMVKHLTTSGQEEVRHEIIAEPVQETLFTAACNIRSIPELDGERFDAIYGIRIPSNAIPELSQDEIGLLMEVGLLDDAKQTRSISCTEHNADLVQQQQEDDERSVVLRHGEWRVAEKPELLRSEGESYLKLPLYHVQQSSMSSPRPPTYDYFNVLQLTKEDDFVIFGSSKLWKYLSAREAIDIVRNSPDHLRTANLLVKAALQRVRQESLEDVTAMVLFLDHEKLTNGTSLQSLEQCSTNPITEPEAQCSHEDKEQQFQYPLSDQQIQGIAVTSPEGSQRTVLNLHLVEPTRKFENIVEEVQRIVMEQNSELDDPTQKSVISNSEDQISSRLAQLELIAMEQLDKEGCDVLETPSNKVESSIIKKKQTSSKDFNSSPYNLAQGDYFEKNELSVDAFHEEILKIGNINEVFNNHGDLQSLLHGEETIILCCYNAKNNLFEFYFKNCEDMASIVGVGLEYAKAILVEGWRVKIKEISKMDWEQAWNIVESSSTTLFKLLKLEPCTLHHVNKDSNSLDFGNFIERPLLWDFAKYFTLKETIAKLVAKDTYAKCAGGSSSSSQSSGGKSSQGYDGDDEKESNLVQAFIKWFPLRREENGEESNDDERNHNKEKEHVDPNHSFDINADTTVSVELLSGGDILGETNFDEESRQKLRSLDKTIVPNLDFIFVNPNGIKEVQVKVGYICFNLGWNGFHEHGETQRLCWFHENLKVSFGLFGVAQNFGELLRDSFEHLDVKTGTENMKASQTIEKKKGREIVVKGGFDGKPYGVGFAGHIEGKTSTLNGDIQQLETSFERSCDVSRGGLIFKQIIDPDDYQIACEYIFSHSKDIYADLHRSPMCNNQAVKFKGIWIPLDDQFGYSPSFVEYSLKASRCLQEIVPKRKDSGNEHLRRRKFNHEDSQTTYEQTYVKTMLINHAMTHLDGKAYKLRERRGETLGTSYLTEQRSMRPPQWNDPLVKLERFS